MLSQPEGDRRAEDRRAHRSLSPGLGQPLAPGRPACVGLARPGRGGGQDLPELRMLLAALCASLWGAQRQNPGHPFGKDLSGPESRGEVRRAGPASDGKGKSPRETAHPVHPKGFSS